MRFTLLYAIAAFAFVACSTTKPEPPVPGEPALDLGAAKASPAAEPPAVVVRVRKVDGRFVAEVVDVRSDGAGAPDPATRKEAVERVQTLFGNSAKVVDPEQQHQPPPAPIP